MQKRAVLCVTNDLVIDQRVHRVATWLHQQGVLVTLVGRRYAETPELSKRVYRTHRLRLRFRTGKLFYVEYQLRLFAYLLWVRPHIITANDLDTLLPCTLAARLLGAQLVYDAHELFTEVPELVARPTEQTLWRALERMLVPHLNTYTTVSEPVLAAYEARYGRPVALVRNLPLRREPPADSVHENIVIYQGALKAGRGLEIMLQALQRPGEWTLWLVGGGLWEARLKKMATALGVTDRVKFWGWVPFEELPKRTRQARLGLSLEDPNAPNTRMSAPNKLFDYLQDGLPVIAADLPVHRRVVETYGVGEVLVSRTPLALAELVTQLLNDPERYTRYRANALLAAHELCWEHEAERLRPLYFPEEKEK